MRDASSALVVPICPGSCLAADDRALSLSQTQGSRSHANTTAPVRHKRATESLAQDEPSQKR